MVLGALALVSHWPRTFSATALTRHRISFNSFVLFDDQCWRGADPSEGASDDCATNKSVAALPLLCTDSIQRQYIEGIGWGRINGFPRGSIKLDQYDDVSTQNGVMVGYCGWPVLCTVKQSHRVVSSFKLVTMGGTDKTVEEPMNHVARKAVNVVLYLLPARVVVAVVTNSMWRWHMNLDSTVRSCSRHRYDGETEA